MLKMLYFWKKFDPLKRKLPQIAAFTLILLSLARCEKDDICPEETPTTPHLIIRFYDLADTESVKNVNSLFAYALDPNDEIINFADLNIASTDSIVIPLQTNMMNTRFALHKDYAVDNNGTPEDPSDDMLLGNPDIITLSYQPEDVYVSRACGFRTVFNGIVFDVDLDGDNWIINSELQQVDIVNEFSAHVKVFH